MDTNEIHLLLCFAIPLFAVFTSATVKHANLRDSLTLIAAGALFANVLKLFSLFKQNPENIKLTAWEIFPKISIEFSLEPLGMIFAIVISFLWIVSSLYSIGYMRGNKEKNHNKFFSFFALSIFSAFGIALSSNMMTLFIFYELLTICTYPLVTHSGTDEAKKSGRIYLGVLMGTSIMLLLPAILITSATAGTLEFTKGGILEGNISDSLAAILLFLYMFGIGKAALMPIHKWLPAAMVAPTPVSALLHAVAVVKAGVFTIVKVIVYIFGTDYLQTLMNLDWWYGSWLLYAAGFTIIVSSIIALRQDNLKKRLAYSTVSQLSYVIIAASILAPKAIIAAAFHIVAHAFGKITLFFAAGSIYTASHKKNISQLSGIGKRMPLTMAAFAIASLSMIGIPPAVGFISKWYLISGAISTETYFAIAVVLVSTILNAGYFLPIIYKAFFEEEKFSTEKSNTHGEAPLPILIAITITAIGTLSLFIYPDIFLDLAKNIL